ncbi:hypothetical protein K1T71_004663 [Dendrolimus kikuchii]|uniref:Uncharacterized protein n=1 Tax=Dendrolimus kikuchii TaxID=765133 RepID=A0ACC1D943_9NEOP|nr:hypothetical protein K1T71_004663 [Dendrolimus kikuchii]
MPSDEYATQTSSNCRLQFIELPPGDQDILETHLVTSCRYYSNLLTKKLGRVRENFARHFPATAEDYICEIPGLALVEACTMKPSGRGELGCQTHRRSNSKTRRHNSCFFLSPASSLTDICRHDKKHLKSVYYMLSSIEGRLRRLRANLPVSSESFA